MQWEKQYLKDITQNKLLTLFEYSPLSNDFRSGLRLIMDLILKTVPFDNDQSTLKTVIHLLKMVSRCRHMYDILSKSAINYKSFFNVNSSLDFQENIILKMQYRYIVYNLLYASLI